MLICKPILTVSFILSSHDTRDKLSQSETFLNINLINGFLEDLLMLAEEQVQLVHQHQWPHKKIVWDYFFVWLACHVRKGGCEHIGLLVSVKDMSKEINNWLTIMDASSAG